MDIEGEVGAIDAAALAEPVRRLLGDETAEVHSWECTPLLAGTGDLVHRVAGLAHSRGREVLWSLVLKLVPGVGGDRGGRGRQRGAWWTHEALAYRSGLLDRLPGDLVAPRCLGSRDRPGGAVWLWLEEVADDLPGPWPLSRYALAARHLGAFNGAFPEDRAGRAIQREGPSAGAPVRLLPDAYPWLSRGWLREWVERDGWGGGWRGVIDDPDTWRHALMRRAYPVPIADRLRNLHAGRGALLDGLDELPHALCHLDAFRRNLFARRLPGGREQTVAIDWPSIGFAALGEEVGKMASTSVLFFDAEHDQATALLDAAIEGYLAGLRESGWTIDGALVRGVRHAAGVSAGLHWACTAAAFPYVMVQSEREESAAWVRRVFGCSAEDLLARWAPVTYWLLDLADGARSLGPIP